MKRIALIAIGIVLATWPIAVAIAYVIPLLGQDAPAILGVAVLILLSILVGTYLVGTEL